MKALVYCRVSTTGQEEKGSSLGSQATECTKFAEEQGYTVVETVKEVFSGAYLFDRPKLYKCREKLREGAYDAVVVYAIDRLSRDVAHLAILVDEVERYGAKLFFVTEDLDKTAEGKLILSVKGYVAEVERLKIRERSMRGKRAIVNAGKLFAPSCDPYGYGFDRETRTRTLVKDEATVVRRIFKEFVEEQSTMRSIMIRLNAENIPSPGDKKKNFRNYDTFRYVAETGHTMWHSGTVHRILKNPMYMGKTFALRHESGTVYKDGKRQRCKLKPQSEWVELPADITPAIVSKELYEAAQVKLKSNVGNGTRNETRPALLRGLIYCECGAKMAPAWSKPDKSRPEYIYFNYRCRSGASTVRCGIPGAQVNGTKVEAAVWARITEILSNPETLRLELQQRQEVSDTERDEVNARITKTRAGIAGLNHAISLLVGRMALVDDAAFVAVQTQINAKAKVLKQLETVLAEAERHLVSLDADIAEVTTIADYCTTFGENLGRLEFQDKRMIVEALGLNVVGNAGKARVSLSIPTDIAAINSVRFVGRTSMRRTKERSVNSLPVSFTLSVAI